MKVCGIYKIVSPSGKIYIGQSIDIIKRFSRYFRLDCKTQQKVYESLKKHGPCNHKFEIICQCDKEELNDLEKYYIELYQCFNSKFGLNLREGGGSKAKCSELTKLKISIANTGLKRNAISRERYRQRQIGKSPSVETRKRLSDANKGKKMTEETKNKLREINTGKKLTKEHKEKLSLAKIGKKRTAESIGKSAKSRHKPVLQIDINTNKILAEFDCITVAQKKLNITHIGTCCNNKRKSSGGYKWEFKKK